MGKAKDNTCTVENPVFLELDPKGIYSWIYHLGPTFFLAVMASKMTTVNIRRFKKINKYKVSFKPLITYYYLIINY